MKYAVLSYEHKKLRLDGNDKQNIGDWIQTIAAEMLFTEFGFKDYIRISRNRLDAFQDDEDVTLLCNGWNSFSQFSFYKGAAIPLPKNITPCFFSFNMDGFYIPTEAKDYLSLGGPVGCRDIGTKERLKANGIDAYLTGCITSLMPRRDVDEVQQIKTILIDVPPILEEAMPKEILDQCERCTNAFRIERKTGMAEMTLEESKQSYDFALNRLEYLKKYAKLVITSNLHIASPCVAMGIPVIFFKQNIDERFAWLDKYIPLYSTSDINNIDWNPKPIDYEQDKKKIKNILMKQLVEKEVDEKDVYFMESYYSDRYETKYNEVLNKLFDDGVDDYKKYRGIAVCGVVNETIWVVNYLLSKYPELPFLAVYDDYMDEGTTFEGITIKKTACVKYEKDVLYVLSSNRAEATLRSKLLTNECKYVVSNIKHTK